MVEITDGKTHIAIPKEIWKQVDRLIGEIKMKDGFGVLTAVHKFGVAVDIPIVENDEKPKIDINKVDMSCIAGGSRVNDDLKSIPEKICQPK